MKGIMLVIALLCSPVYANDINDMAPPEPYDKILHFGVSAGMTYLGHKFLVSQGLSPTTSRIVSSLVTFAITGPGKELMDDNFDLKDMGASGAGTIAGIGLTFKF